MWPEVSWAVLLLLIYLSPGNLRHSPRPRLQAYNTSALQGTSRCDPSQSLFAVQWDPKSNAVGRRSPSAIEENCIDQSMGVAPAQATKRIASLNYPPSHSPTLAWFLESLGDVVSGDGGRMAALKQAFMPDPKGDPEYFS
jgi:hypothetical protein